MRITPGFLGDTGLLGLLEAQVIELETGDDIVSRTTAGIGEFATGDTVSLYVMTADIPITRHYAVVWWLDSELVEAEIGEPPPTAVYVPIVQPVPSPAPVPGTWYYKRGDDRIPLIGQFTWNGLPQDIRGVDQLLFKVRLALPGGPDLASPMAVNSYAIPIPCPDPHQIDDGSWWSYRPQSTDFANVGQYDAEIEARWSDGTVLTSPTISDLSHEYYRIVVVEDLDGVG